MDAVKMIKVGILDDDKVYVDEIVKFLRTYLRMPYEVYTYTKTEDFLKVLLEVRFDLLFLDIILDQMDGIEIGRMVIEKYSDTQIIFISSNAEYFRDVYKVNHIYFLTKEFESKRFADAMIKVAEFLSGEYVTLRTKKGMETVRIKNIVCIESKLRNTVFYMSDGSSLIRYIALQQVEEDLPQHFFVRTHKSFIVNMRYIIRYNSHNIDLIGGRTISISRGYLTSAREKISLFLGDVL